MLLVPLNLYTGKINTYIVRHRRKTIYAVDQSRLLDGLLLIPTV